MKKLPVNLNDRETLLYCAITSKPGISYKELCRVSKDVTVSAVTKCLTNLVKRGLIVKIKERDGKPTFFYPVEDA